MNDQNMKHSYKIIHKGSKVGQGASQPCYGRLNSVVKKNDEQRKYIVANEIVAHALAQHLLLPIPIGGIATDGDEEPCYFSLEIFPDGPKPIQRHVKDKLEEIVDKFTELCWGITLFDALIINKDRKPKNLACPENLESIHIFDHGHCLFEKVGLDRVTKHQEWIGIGDNHCLAKLLKDTTGYKAWMSSIRDIPDGFIRKAAMLGEEVGYTSAECRCISDFLIARRCKLHQLVLNQLGKFNALEEEEKEKLRQMDLT